MKITETDSEVGIVTHLRNLPSPAAYAENELLENAFPPDWPEELNCSQIYNSNPDSWVIYESSNSEDDEIDTDDTGLSYSQRTSPDFIGWYGSFRKFKNWGIYLRIEELLIASKLMFKNLKTDGKPASVDEKIDRMLQFVIAHERFHLLTDIMVAHIEILSLNLDVGTSRSIYLKKPLPLLNEEKMANAYALRELQKKYSDSTFDVAMEYIKNNALPGYKEGPTAVEDKEYSEGLGDLFLDYYAHDDKLKNTLNLLYEIFGYGIDRASLYPSFEEIVDEIPYYFVSSKCSSDSKNSISFITSISSIEESKKFLKSLKKLKISWVEDAWKKVKGQLKSGQLEQCKFSKWIENDIFYVYVGGNRSPAVRAHLRMISRSPLKFIAEEIGDHKTMGHG